MLIFYILVSFQPTYGQVSSIKPTIHKLADDYEAPWDSESAALSPDVLEYPSSQLFVPTVKLIDVINPTDEPITLLKINCNQIEIQVSHVLSQEIPPKSLFRLPIVFLPRVVGRIESEMFFITSLGTSKAIVRAQATPNVYKIRSMTNITIPVKTMISMPISMYNPKKTKYQVKEIYTSEKFFHLSLPTSRASLAKLWELRPREAKTVIDMKFQSAVPGIFLGYIHLHTQDYRMVIPVEIKVLKEFLSYKPKIIDFGVLTYKGQSATRSIDLENLGIVPISCKDFKFTPERKGITFGVDWITGVVPANHRFRIQLTVTNRDAKEDFEVVGSFTLLANLSEISIPYKLKVILGTLSYSRNSVLFRLPVPRDNTKKLNAGCKVAENAVTFINRFRTPLHLVAVTLSHPAFNLVIDPTSLEKTILPGQRWSPCKIRFEPTRECSQVQSISAAMKVKTNISTFTVDVQAFDGSFEVMRLIKSGFVTYKSGNEHGISGEALEKDGPTMLAIGKNSRWLFDMRNPNPVPIKLIEIKSSIQSMKIETTAEGPVEDTIIPANDLITVMVNMTSTRPVKDKTIRLSIKTEVPFFKMHPCPDVRRTTRLSIPFRYALMKGSLEITPASITLSSAHPGLVSKSLLSATNKYDVPIKLEWVDICKNRLGKCVGDSAFKFRFLEKNISPSEKIEIGELVFDPNEGIFSDHNYKLPYTGQMGPPTPKEVNDFNHISALWKNLEKEGLDRVERYLRLGFDVVGVMFFNVKATLARPRIFVDNFLDFGSVQINTSRNINVRVSNPTDSPISLSFGAVDEPESSGFSLRTTISSKIILNPGEEAEMGPVQFLPRSEGKSKAMLYIRNNATQLDRIGLSGSGIDQALFFDMLPEDDKQYEARDGSQDSASVIRESIEHEGYIYHLMPLEPPYSLEDDKSANYWRLSMYNGGSEEIVVTGLKAGVSSCDKSHMGIDGKSQDSQIRNCDLLPLHIGPGSSASFRVLTGSSEDDQSMDDLLLMAKQSSLEAILFPLAEHQFLVSTTSGDYRLLLTVPIMGLSARIARALNVIGMQTIWTVIALCITVIGVGLVVIPPKVSRTSQKVTDKMSKSSIKNPPELGQSLIPGTKRKNHKETLKSRRRRSRNSHRKEGLTDTPNQQKKVDLNFPAEEVEDVSKDRKVEKEKAMESKLEQKELSQAKVIREKEKDISILSRPVRIKRRKSRDRRRSLSEKLSSNARSEIKISSVKDIGFSKESSAPNPTKGFDTTGISTLQSNRRNSKEKAQNGLSNSKNKAKLKSPNRTPTRPPRAPSNKSSPQLQAKVNVTNITEKGGTSKHRSGKVASRRSRKPEKSILAYQNPSTYQETEARSQHSRTKSLTRQDRVPKKRWDKKNTQSVRIMTSKTLSFTSTSSTVVKPISSSKKVVYDTSKGRALVHAEPNIGAKFERDSSMKTESVSRSLSDTISGKASTHLDSVQIRSPIGTPGTGSRSVGPIPRPPSPIELDREASASSSVIFQPRLGGLGALGFPIGNSPMPGQASGLSGPRFPTFHHSELLSNSASKVGKTPNLGPTSSLSAKSGGSSTQWGKFYDASPNRNEGALVGSESIFGARWGSGGDSSLRTTLPAGIRNGSTPSRFGVDHKTKRWPFWQDESSNRGNSSWKPSSSKLQLDVDSKSPKVSVINKDNVRLNYIPAQEPAFFDFLDSPGSKEKPKMSQLKPDEVTSAGSGSSSGKSKV